MAEAGPGEGAELEVDSQRDVRRARLAPVPRPRSHGREIRWRRWAGGAALLLAGATTTAALAAPSYVRKKVVAKAHARGIELSVGRVHIGWGRVELFDVEGTLEGVGGVHGSANRASVGYTLAGLADGVTVEGARLGLDGGPDELHAEIAAWRERHATTSEPSARSSRSLSLRGVEVIWRSGGVELARATADSIELAAERIGVAGGGGTVHLGGVDVRAAGMTAEYWRSQGVLGSIDVNELGVVFIGAGEAPASMADDAVSVPSDDAGARVWSKLGRIRGVLERAHGRFIANADLRVHALTVTTDRGALGPWGAHAILGDDATSIEVVPADGDGRKPLDFRALIPRGPGKWRAEMALGPATLSEIGVQEKAFGLVDVAQTTIEAKGSVELDPDLQTFAADGSIHLKNGSFSDPKVADGTVTGIELGARGVVTSKGDFHSWTLVGGVFELGKLKLEIDGAIEAGALAADGKRPTSFSARWNLPNLSCSDALSSLPSGLVPKLAGMAMEGTFGAHGSVGFDTRAVDKTQLEFFVDQKCRIVRAPPSLSVERFREPFDLRVYDPSGKPGEMRAFGPGTGSWASYSNISPYVTDAILTCEDGAFFSHNGFSPMAIRNAIVANLKAGKFALGASTVTMQLAKNVFLDRRKQLSRKVQEAVLTAWLEQAMSKSEILELYLNVIEFGPNLYGIGPASWHYFGRPPSDLDPLEATFLVSILPSPVKRHFMWERGAISDGYLDYLRTLLREEHRRGKLDDVELEEALKAPFVFHKPGDPTPEPHVINKEGGTLKVHDDDGSGGGTDFDPVWAPTQ